MSRIYFLGDDDLGDDTGKPEADVGQQIRFTQTARDLVNTSRSPLPPYSGEHYLATIAGVRAAVTSVQPWEADGIVAKTFTFFTPSTQKDSSQTVLLNLTIAQQNVEKQLGIGNAGWTVQGPTRDVSVAAETAANTPGEVAARGKVLVDDVAKLPDQLDNFKKWLADNGWKVGVGGLALVIVLRKLRLL